MPKGLTLWAHVSARLSRVSSGDRLGRAKAALFSVRPGPAFTVSFFLLRDCPQSACSPVLAKCSTDTWHGPGSGGRVVYGESAVGMPMVDGFGLVYLGADGENRSGSG